MKTGVIILFFLTIGLGIQATNVTVAVAPPEPIHTTTAVPPITTPANTTNSTTTAPTSPTTPTTTAKTTTTPKPDTTTAIPPKPDPPKPTTTTEKPTTTPAPHTTVKPSPTPQPTSATTTPIPTLSPSQPTGEPPKERHFDGLSFMGGMILTVCIVGIAAFSWKFYKAWTDRSYRTL